MQSFWLWRQELQEELDDSPLPQSVKEALLASAEKDEQLVRRLLERWVSGCDPAIAMTSDGKIIGLCDANAMPGTKPFVLRP